MYTKLSITKPIAKKEHKCELCSKPIGIGSRYDKVFEGSFQSVKLHEVCRELCNSYDGEDYYFQDVYEWAIGEGKLK